MMIITIIIGSRSSVVDTATRLQAGQSGVRIPVRARNSSVRKNRIYRVWGTTQPPVPCVLEVLPGDTAAVTYRRPLNSVQWRS